MSTEITVTQMVEAKKELEELMSKQLNDFSEKYPLLGLRISHDVQLEVSVMHNGKLNHHIQLEVGL